MGYLDWLDPLLGAPLQGLAQREAASDNESPTRSGGTLLPPNPAASTASGASQMERKPPSREVRSRRKTAAKSGRQRVALR